METKYTIQEIERAFFLSHPISSFEAERKRREHWEKIKERLSQKKGGKE